MATSAWSGIPRARTAPSRSTRTSASTPPASGLYAACLRPGDTVEHAIESGRGAWLQLARGAVALNGHAMKEGDGAALADEDVVRAAADAESEVLLFDLV